MQPVADAEPPPDLVVDAVVATSANAFRCASPDLLRAFDNRLLLAVGRRTEEAARAAGFTEVRSADGDALDLVMLVERSVEAGGSLLYLAGVERGPVLEIELRHRGFRLVVVETYGMPEIRYSPQDLSERLGDHPVDVALLYSSRGGRLLRVLTLQPQVECLFGKTMFLAISGVAAAALNIAAGGGRSVRVAERPNEDALLALLPID